MANPETTASWRLAHTEDCRAGRHGPAVHRMDGTARCVYCDAPLNSVAVADDHNKPLWLLLKEGLQRDIVARLRAAAPDGPRPSLEEEAASEIERLRGALAFARSAIKSGDPWTETCERN